MVLQLKTISDFFGCNGAEFQIIQKKASSSKRQLVDA
jgi:hypothetical protein